MTKIVLYMAISPDGYIARKDNDINGWPAIRKRRGPAEHTFRPH